MANIFNTEQRLLLGALETVQGTPITLSASDGDVRVRSLELSTLSVEYDDESSKYLTGDHTRDEAIAGVARGAIDFGIKFAPGEIETTGGTVSDAKLPYGKYLEGAGLLASDPVGTSATYWEFVPEVEADSQTMTAAIYDRQTGSSGVGIEYKIAGAMSTLTIESESAGKPFMCNFSLQGKVSDVSEVAHGDLPAFDDDNALSTLADKMLNTDIIITELAQDGSDIGATPVSFCVNSFSLDTGLTIAEIMCQADAYGILHNTITERDPRVTVDPLLKALSDFDFWNALNSEKVYRLDILSYEDPSKTKPFLTIEVPRAQIITADGSDDNGFRRNALTMRPLRNLQGATSKEKEHDYIIRIGANVTEL